MLGWRLSLGIFFVAALVGICWLDYHAQRPGAYLLPLAAVLSVLGASELLAMFRKRGHELRSLVVYGGVLIAILLAGMPVIAPDWQAGQSVTGLGWLAIGLAVGFIAVIVGEMHRFEAAGSATINLGLASLVILYAGGL